MGEEKLDFSRITIIFRRSFVLQLDGRLLNLPQMAVFTANKLTKSCFLAFFVLNN